MLTTCKQSRLVANGLTRRNFLAVGPLLAGSYALAGLLRAEAKAQVGSSTKAVVNIHLDGGPPHLDMIDLKPEAPVEIRGEFAPIATRIPGYGICELLPKMAGMADRLVFIRSLVGSVGAHDAFQCQAGYPEPDLKSIGGRPAMGSVVARLRGAAGDAAPAFVDLMQGRPLVRNSARPGFLGPAYQPFRPDISAMFSRPLEEGMKRELADKGSGHTTSLGLIDGLSVDRLGDRTCLLRELDRLSRTMDGDGTMGAMDAFTQQAVGILTSGRFAASMDLDQESPRVVARYAMRGGGQTESPIETSDGASWPKKLLMARRLIEAGVRCVSLSLSDFDTHTANFQRMRHLLPILDHGLHAFISDLSERGMLDDVSIVAWGEFGRTPKVDVKTIGRHHWPNVGMALLAGGGMQTGQVIGSTDRTASIAASRPVHYQDVFATLYHNLGIDLADARLIDTSGRPQMLIDAGQSIKELVSL
ncbi:MAG: DUF1501 domain-containing protein [Planctomycetaceae bacterium]|nr:DUF1501 domain-containing protein [Planctomycetaceae bacterium]